MMHWTKSQVLCVGIALVVIYGTVVPLLLVTPASAHKHFIGDPPNEIWAHSVDTSNNRKRMRVWNDSADAGSVGYAIVSWDNIGVVNVRQLSNAQRSDRTVKTARYGEPNLSDLSHGCYRVNWLGLYDYAGRVKPDVIFINYCMAFWSGGRWPNTGELKGPTSSDRRLRTFVHEVGHALGLDHNPLDQCYSVMRDIPSDAVAICYSPVNGGPVPHDGDDLRAYW